MKATCTQHVIPNLTFKGCRFFHHRRSSSKFSKVIENSVVDTNVVPRIRMMCHGGIYYTITHLVTIADYYFTMHRKKYACSDSLLIITSQHLEYFERVSFNGELNEHVFILEPISTNNMLSLIHI